MGESDVQGVAGLVSCVAVSAANRAGIFERASTRVGFVESGSELDEGKVMKP